MRCASLLALIVSTISQVVISGLTIVVVLTKFCTDSDGNSTIVEDGWLRKARKNQQRIPESNPEVEKAKAVMNNRYDQLKKRIEGFEDRYHTTLENLQLDVSNLQRINAVSCPRENIDQADLRGFQKHQFSPSKTTNVERTTIFQYVRER